MSAGIILLDKAGGMTSAQAIAKVKRALSVDKIGHAGTLDPMATGLLVCLTGRATRCAQYAEDGQKRYSGTILLGRVTTTDDVTGETLTTSDLIPSEDAVQKGAKTFVGEIEQLPPQFSALKVNGERAYDLARKGEKVALAKRKITVYEFSVRRTGDKEISFVCRCSPGTYIRSLARDLGELLGCGGCLATLRREASYPFEVSNAKPLESLTQEDILRWDILFPHVPRHLLEPHEVAKLKGGQQQVLSTLGPAKTPLSLYGDVKSKELCGILVAPHGKWELGVHLS